VLVAAIGCPSTGPEAPEDLPPGGVGRGPNWNHPNASRNVPVGAEMEVTVEQDGSLDFALEGSDADGDTLKYRIATRPANGKATVTPPGPAVRYLPNPGFKGVDSFTYLVNDGVHDSRPATVVVFVTDVNAAPVAENATHSLVEDTAAAFNLSGSDVDAELLAYLIVTQPMHGTVVVDGNGPGVQYTPNPDYFGTDLFTFVTTDGVSESNVSTVTLTITPVNDAPEVRGERLTVAASTATTFDARTRDAENDFLRLRIATYPAHGAAVAGANATILYRPVAGFTGMDTFTVIANDGELDSLPATMTMMVESANFLANATAASHTTDEDQFVTFDLQADNTDGAVMTYAVVTQPEHGAVSIAGSGPSATYTPDANFNGTDSFTFAVSDGTYTSQPATVTIAVNPVNDAPEASNANATARAGEPVTIALSATDIDGDTLSYFIVGNATNGAAVLLGAGPSVTYTANPDYTGSDSFRFVANDGTANSNVATVTITVTAAIDTTPAQENGWTIFEQAPGARTFYVDPAAGNDSNDALSAARPGRTIASVKPRLQRGDWMLLKRGTTFNEPIGSWNVSGVSAQYKTLVSAYGEGARPVIRSGAAFGIKFTGPPSEIAKHVAVTDIAFIAPDDPLAIRNTGISATGAVDDLWFEGLLINGHAGNIVINGLAAERASNITVRRCVSMYSIHHQAGLHTQGLFIKECDGLLVEENYFHHNGWRDGGHMSPLAHNVYLSQSNGPATVRRNISTYSSNNGLMIRGGGVIEDNIVAYSPTGIVAGTEKTDRHSFEIPAVVRNNVVLNATDASGGLQQWGIIAINLADSEISGNIVAHSKTNDGYGFSIRSPQVFRNVTLRDNVVYNVGRGLLTFDNLYQDVTVASNAFIGMQNYFLDARNTGPVMGMSPEFTFEGNTYDGGASLEPFHMLWTGTTTDQRWYTRTRWINEVEANADYDCPPLVDPDRDLASYHATVGGAASMDAFVAAMMAQRKGAWNAALDTLPMVTYFREGYAPQAAPPAPVSQPVVAPAQSDTNETGAAGNETAETAVSVDTVGSSYDGETNAIGAALQTEEAAANDGMSVELCLDTLFGYLANPEYWFDGQFGTAGDGTPDVIEDALAYLNANGSAGFDVCTAYSLAAEAMDLLERGDDAESFDYRALSAWDAALNASTEDTGAEIMARVRLANRFGDESYLDGVNALLSEVDPANVSKWDLYELALRDGGIAEWAYYGQTGDAAFLFAASLVAGEDASLARGYRDAALRVLNGAVVSFESDPFLAMMVLAE
jgi:hypothetical protein